ncbi:hypothetical protein, partial [Limosilactobacillus reuteri]|uniref:hypothetical protein n=1 Tax=Limosilactobacillus reuteri TaxID=1598 RepID=UPI0030D26151
IAPFGCFCGNYIISGTISCIHKSWMMNRSKNSSSSFFFELGVAPAFYLLESLLSFFHNHQYG